MRIHREKRPDHIIRIFMTNLTTTSRTQFLADLCLSKTQFCIYTECVDMDINLPDICRAIQFKISDYIMSSELLQQLGFGRRDASCIVIALVFIEMQQILPDDVHTLERSAFTDFWLPIIRKNCNQITDIIIRLYCKYIRLNTPKIESLYQRTDPAIL